MRFKNTPPLKAWLERDHPELAIQTEFELDAARFHAFRKQLHTQGDHRDPKGDRQKEAEALDLAALFATLTWQGPKSGIIAPVAASPATSHNVLHNTLCDLESPQPLVPEAASIMLAVRSLRTWLRIIAVILLLLLAKTVHGQSIASGDITVANAACTATSCVSMTLFGQS